MRYLGLEVKPDIIAEAVLGPDGPGHRPLDFGFVDGFGAELGGHAFLEHTACTHVHRETPGFEELPVKAQGNPDEVELLADILAAGLHTYVRP